MSEQEIKIIDSLVKPPPLSDKEKLEMLKQAQESTLDPQIKKQIESEITELVRKIHLDD
jgi:hypothetical protein